MGCAECQTLVDFSAPACPACGARVPDLGGPASPGADRSVSATVRPRKLWLGMVVTGVVGLVLVGVASVRLLLGSSADPEHAATDASPRAASEEEDTVREFFEALAARDARKALSLVALTARNDGDNPLLSERTLSDPGYFPPRRFRIELVQPDRNGIVLTPAPPVAVKASYEAAGMQFQARFTLVRGQAGSGPVRWLVSNPLLPLAVRHAASDTVIIAGTPVRNTTTIFALPGAYVAALPPHPLINAEPVTVLAGLVDRQVPLHARAREGAAREIEPQVRSYVDACARRRESDPEGCPFDSAPNHVYPPTVVRRIVEYPRLRVAAGSWGELSVTSESAGRAEVTGPRRDSFSPPATVLESFTVTGTVKLVDGKLVFYPQR